MNKSISRHVSKAEQRWADATKREKQVRKASEEVASLRTEKIARLRALRSVKEEADRLAAEKDAADKAKSKDEASAGKKKRPIARATEA